MSGITGARKVAILFAAVGEEAAAELLPQLSEDEQVLVGRAMAELEEFGVEKSEAHAVLEEFKRVVDAGSEPSFEGTLTRAFTRAFGVEQGRTRVEKIRDVTRVARPFRFLELLRPADVARLIGDEHPQLRAFVLAHLESSVAAEILGQFDEDEQVDLVFRMAAMQDTSPRTARRVAASLAKRAEGLEPRHLSDGRSEDERLKAVADILNAAGPGADREILTRMESKDHFMVHQIREQMFSWLDLARLDQRTMQKILSGIDTKLLALALKACDERVQGAILGATSQRTRDMILDERDLIGSVPLSEVVEAQKQILLVIRELIDSGEVVIDRGSSVQYVS